MRPISSESDSQALPNWILRFYVPKTFRTLPNLCPTYILGFRLARSMLVAESRRGVLLQVYKCAQNSRLRKKHRQPAGTCTPSPRYQETEIQGAQRQSTRLPGPSSRPPLIPPPNPFQRYRLLTVTRRPKLS